MFGFGFHKSCGYKALQINLFGTENENKSNTVQNEKMEKSMK